MVREGWKPCPSCKEMIEKEDGCDHMQCECGHEFCYQCWRSYTGGMPCNCHGRNAWVDNVDEEENDPGVQQEILDDIAGGVGHAGDIGVQGGWGAPGPDEQAVEGEPGFDQQFPLQQRFPETEELLRTLDGEEASRLTTEEVDAPQQQVGSPNGEGLQMDRDNTEQIDVTDVTTAATAAPLQGLQTGLADSLMMEPFPLAARGRGNFRGHGNVIGRGAGRGGAPPGRGRGQPPAPPEAGV